MASLVRNDKFGMEKIQSAVYLVEMESGCCKGQHRLPNVTRTYSFHEWKSEQKTSTGFKTMRAVGHNCEAEMIDSKV